jgi:diguanylate cyclase (GGDEF)-like protein/PAS domain S-box-containing protein
MNPPRDVISEELRILILEDTVADAELCKRELERAGLRFTSRRVETRAAFEAALDEFRPGLIISDFTMPGAFDGLAALVLARLKYPGVPFVFVSGTIGEERAVEAMKHGATDYVLKDHIRRLAPVVKRAIEEARERAARRRAEEELERTRNQLNGILSSLSDVVWSFSLRENRLIYVNTSNEKTLGRAAVDFYIHTDRWLEAIHPQDRDRVEHEWRNAHTSGKFESIYRIVLPDGRVRWVQDRGSVVWDAKGQPERVDGIARDITQLKLQEQRIERLNRVYAVLSGINSTIVRVRDRDELFRESCRIAGEHGNFGLAWVGLFDPATLEVTPAAWAGLGTEEMKQAKATARPDVPQGQGLVGRAIRERKPVFDNDISAGPKVGNKRREEALRLGFRSLMVLPLFTEGAVTGTLALFAKEANFFDDEEVKLLAELAGNISFALASLARQEKIERLSRIRNVTSQINAAIVRSRSKQDLFDEACRIAVEHGGFGIAWVGALDPKKLEVTPVASVGLEDGSFSMRIVSSVRADAPQGEGMLPRAVRERRPVYNNDITVNAEQGSERRKEAIRRGYRSVMVLPLIVDGDVAGTFSMYAKELNYFDSEEAGLLTELAGNISFALEHMRVQEKIEKLSRIRRVTSEINAAIVRSRDKQALFDEACRIAVEHGKFGIAWIGRFDPEKLEIAPVASAGLEKDAFLMHNTLVIRHDTPHRQSLIAGAIRERRAAYNNDIVIDAEVGGERRKEAIRRGYRSAIALPFMVEGAVVGSFSLFAKETNFFDDEEVGLLTELAGNISLALEHIARQEKIEKLSRIHAVSGSINAAIVRTRERHALLKEACRIVSEQGKFDLVWIGTVDQEKQGVRPVTWKGFSEETAHSVSWASVNSAKGTIGEAMLTRKASVRNDIEAQLAAGKLREEALQKGYHSSVCLPLVVDDKVTTFIVLFAAGRGFFDKDELALLDEVASNLSFALESIAGQGKIDRLSRIRSVLGGINAAIVRIRTKKELFEEACHILAEAGRFQLAWIGVVDQDTMQIKPVARAGAAPESSSNMQAPRPLDDKAPQGRGPSAEAVLEKRAVIVNDVQNDPRISRKQDHLERNINSIAVLPLLVADEAVGVLALHAREAGFFDEEEMKLLAELAGDIAFALQTIEKQEKLDYLSYFDTLTGLPNRTLFVDRAGQQMRSRAGEPLLVALILINIERFRNINESFGRNGGDELLKLVAGRLENAFNGKDYLARVGADSFGVVMRGIRDTAAVVNAIENQVLGCFREPFKVGGSELRAAAKAGIALFPADGADADTLFKNAEAALKKAQGGSERFLFYAADMNARIAHALTLENRLRKAVEAQQFVLHYQPKIDLSNDAICGLEALIRWQDPETGLVPPGSFIPLLEETGLILEVGKWALTQALLQHREWTARGCKAPRVAVNVSAIQLQQKDFADMVINVVQEGGRIPEALELEITESLLMKDVDASIRKLSLLRGLGIHIAMDDFGTGYSSLSYVARLPINSIKIDRSFINGMANSPQDMAIVTTIIALAHSLNLRVVAEGVETESQSKLLKLLKCDEAQGYLFSKPIPAPDIERLLLTLPPEAWGRGTKAGLSAKEAP